MRDAVFSVFRYFPFILFLLIRPGCLSAQTVDLSGQVTLPLLQSRAQLVENSPELSDSLKTLILEKYHQITADLELAEAHNQQQEALQEAFRRTPVEIEAIRNAIEQRREVDPVRNLQIAENISDEELERLLEQELTDLNAAESMLKNLETDLEEELQQPALIRNRIINAKLLIDEINRQQSRAGGAEANSLIAEAEQWATQARASALQAEINMLDQKLLGNRSQVRLIRYRQEEVQEEITRFQNRLELIRNALRDRRREEMAFAVTQANSILEADTLQQAALTQIAEANLELVAIRNDQIEMLDSLDRSYNHFRPIALQLTNAFMNTKRKLNLKASSAPLGRVIREERAHFPQTKTLIRERQEINQQIAEVSLRLITLEEERRTMGNPVAYLEDFLEESGTDSLDASSETVFEALVATRGELLDRTISNDSNLERGLYALIEVLDELIEKTEEYDAYLDKRLLWVRSSRPFNKGNFADMYSSIRFFFSPENWLRCGRNVITGLWKTPELLFLLLLAAGLTWRRKQLLEALSATGRYVKSLHKDRISYTFAAIGYTLLIALPLPLVLWSAGTSLLSAPEQDMFSAGISRGLIIIAYVLVILIFIRSLFLPNGMADLHAGWSGSRLTEMRRLFGWLIALGLPFYFLAVCYANIFPSTQGKGLGLLSFTAYMLVLSWFAYAIRQNVKAGIQDMQYPVLKGWLPFLFALIFIIPPLLAVIAWMGYIYTAVSIYFRIEWSLWALAGLWLVSIIAQRWLLIMRRNLAYQAIQKEREAAPAANKGGTDTAGSSADLTEEEQAEARAELVSLDNDTRRLFNAVLILAFILGLVGIWGQVVPALSVLNEVILWKQNVLVNGKEISSVVTLADLLKAVLYGVIAFVLGKNLPSLINILMIKRGKTSSGTRYAIATLIKYSIALFGILAVLASLGASSAQLGWAAAALSVGIGFGLQEIVANFVSGLILLFERPVRIGDVVTIGDASGVVTSIQIRATTIRGWDRKELLIPNKELVAGRLINWTLSDNTIRVQVKVGVAYGSNVEEAMKIMRETAEKNPRVLKNPPPFTWFEQFGDSTLHLTLNAFVIDVHHRMDVITELNQEVNRQFKEAGITIAFPQLDIHLRSQS